MNIFKYINMEPCLIPVFQDPMSRVQTGYTTQLPAGLLSMIQLLTRFLMWGGLFFYADTLFASLLSSLPSIHGNSDLHIGWVREMTSQTLHETSYLLTWGLSGVCLGPQNQTHSPMDGPGSLGRPVVHAAFTGRSMQLVSPAGERPHGSPVTSGELTSLRCGRPQAEKAEKERP